MKLEIEVPDEWIKSGRQWASHQILSCSQCPYKTPLAALFVAHVYNEHGPEKYVPSEDLILDK